MTKTAQTPKTAKGAAKLKEIDFSRMLNSEQVDLGLDTIRGVIAILDAMELSAEAGHHGYTRQAFMVLSSVCREAVAGIEKMLPNLDYMEDYIRGGS